MVSTSAPPLMPRPQRLRGVTRPRPQRGVTRPRPRRGVARNPQEKPLQSPPGQRGLLGQDQESRLCMTWSLPQKEAWPPTIITT
jgi:hypothetical protein